MIKINPATDNDLTIFNTFGKGNLKSTLTGNNCVIYTRVSTKEQADNNMSLTTQKKACELYASKHGYHIAGSFGGTYESAKNDERKEFNKMLLFVKKSKEQVSYIIVYSVDRFSRSGSNAIFITDQLKKSGVQVISVTQPTDASAPSGSLQQNIQYIFSEYDNQLRREKSMTGTKEALLRGEWCARAPLGYSIVRMDGKRQVVINETGLILKKAFGWKANDNMTIEEIAQRLKGLGVKMYHQKLSVIFRNPFYCGLLSHGFLEGKVVQGNHEPLISKNTFLKVNDLLSTNAQGFTQKHENDHVPLKNFVKCGHCGSSLPGYIVKKKNIWYYKCRTKGCCNNKSAKSLHNTFLNMLEPFQFNLSEQYTKLIKRQISNGLNEDFERKKEEGEQIQSQILDMNRKIDRLEERFILDEITKEQYHKFLEKFKDERSELYRQLEKSAIKVSNLDKAIDNLVDFSSNLPSLWTSGDYNTKVKIQNFIFPEGMSYNKKTDTCRTPKINPLFSYLATLKRGSGGNKNGATEFLSNDANSVPRTGVEPVRFPTGV